MSNRSPIRFKSKSGLACVGTMAVWLAAGAASGQARNSTPAAQDLVPAVQGSVPSAQNSIQTVQNSAQVVQDSAQADQPASGMALDSVAAVVSNQTILASDVEDEVRLAVLDPGQGGLGVLSRQRALDQLISRTLIQQQIRQEDAQATEPSQTEVDARLAEIRQQLPACVRLNCATDQGWKAFLAAHGLTPGQVESYLRNRIQVLRFIEMRFRQGILISPEEIETYYRETLLPQYAPGEAIPPLDTVAPRIQEILLERQVTVLFDDWLQNLRKQGDVEVLDPALEAPETTGKTGKGGA